MKERGNAIVLIGFMGAGKSSVGRTLARMTGLPRFDTDEMVAARFGLTIPEIFEVHGEQKFRDAETEALRELSDKRQAIVVTGGGIVLREENVALLRECGTIVYLAAETTASTVEIAPDLQLLGTNVHLRWRYDSSLFGTRTIGNGFNHPLPSEIAVFVGGPGCAAAFPDLHPPVITVGWNCKQVCERGRDHHPAKHSNQKKASWSHV